MDIVEQTTPCQQHLFSQRLVQLESWLDRAEEQWEDEAIRRDCVNAWQANIKSVWDVAPEPVRKFAASFILSVQQLSPEQLTHEQIMALRHSLVLLRQPALDDATKSDGYQQLVDCGLPPRFVLGNEILELYLNE